MAGRLPPERVITAVLQNLDTWIADGSAGIDAEPNRALMHLVRNMMMARISLKRLVGDENAEDGIHTDP